MDTTRRRRTRRTILAAAIALTLTGGGAAVWAADRFLIEHVEISDVSAYEAAQSADDDATAAATGEVTLTDTSYSDDSSSVMISTVSTGTGDDAATSASTSR